MLSHELRNPLAPIRVRRPLLGGSRRTKDRLARVDVIERQIAHVMRLVDDLLDVSRITTGQDRTGRGSSRSAPIVGRRSRPRQPPSRRARHSLDDRLPDAAVCLRGTARGSRR